MSRIKAYEPGQALGDHRVQMVSPNTADKWIGWLTHRWLFEGKAIIRLTVEEKAEKLMDWVAGRLKSQALTERMPPLQISQFPTVGPHADYGLAHEATCYAVAVAEQRACWADWAEAVK